MQIIEKAVFTPMQLVFHVRLQTLRHMWWQAPFALPPPIFPKDYGLLASPSFLGIVQPYQSLYGIRDPLLRGLLVPINGL